MKNKKFLAVVGAGGWGKNHVRNFSALGVLHTVCDSNAPLLDSYAREYRGVHVTSDFQKVVANHDIRAVVISAPSSLHYSMAKEALLCGKDVFVEKPMSLHVREARELMEISKKKKNVLMVGHILQYHPAVLKLNELIQNGALGKIYYIYSSRLNFGKFRSEENILWSFAPHDISVILMLLRESPDDVASFGGYYLNPDKADTTLTVMRFPSGASAHIFVSWLHPFKEQKLVVVGSQCMAVFDDVSGTNTLMLYPHSVSWVDRTPVLNKKAGEPVSFEQKEPLREECEHFLHCIKTRAAPRTDSEEGLRVLEILTQCQNALGRRSMYSAANPNSGGGRTNVFIHPSAAVDESASIGKDSKIWHFAHVMKDAIIGERCILGQNVFVGEGVKIGNGVKIQNNVAVYKGVLLEDDVFCGPSCVFTNVMNPRSAVERKSEFRKTLVKKGATLGANCTLLCGVTVGKYAFIGAGAVVTKNVADYSLVYGCPARHHGWVCECGGSLGFRNKKSKCAACGMSYVIKNGKAIRVS